MSATVESSERLARGTHSGWIPLRSFGAQRAAPWAWRTAARAPSSAGGEMPAASRMYSEYATPEARSADDDSPEASHRVGADPRLMRRLDKPDDRLRCLEVATRAPATWARAASAGAADAANALDMIGGRVFARPARLRICRSASRPTRSPQPRKPICADTRLPDERVSWRNHLGQTPNGPRVRRARERRLGSFGEDDPAIDHVRSRGTIVEPARETPARRPRAPSHLEGSGTSKSR